MSISDSLKPVRWMYLAAQAPLVYKPNLFGVYTHRDYIRAIIVCDWVSDLKHEHLSAELSSAANSSDVTFDMITSSSRRSPSFLTAFPSMISARPLE